MAQPRIRGNVGITVFPTNDPFGKRSIPGSTALVTDKRTKRWRQSENLYIHRTKNGIHDPYSFFHLVSTVASIKPWEPFTAAELSEYLNRTRPAIVWEPVTVGRILNDVIESFREANGDATAQPINSTRHWNGTYYEVSDTPPARVALLNLIDDLILVADRVRDAEAAGDATNRLTSPLLQCPSLYLPEMAA